MKLLYVLLGSMLGLGLIEAGRPRAKQATPWTPAIDAMWTEFLQWDRENLARIREENRRDLESKKELCTKKLGIVQARQTAHALRKPLVDIQRLRQKLAYIQFQLTTINK